MILSADSLWKALVSALLLPLIGGSVFFSAAFCVTQLFHRPEFFFSWRVVIVPLVGMMIMAHVVSKAYFVIAPLAVTTQLVMSRVGRGHSAPVDRPLLNLAVGIAAASAVFVVWRMSF